MAKIFFPIHQREVSCLRRMRTLTSSHLIDEECLQLVVLGPRELVVRDVAVLVLVLVAEDLLHELVLVRLHLVGLVGFGSARTPDLLNLMKKPGIDIRERP